MPCSRVHALRRSLSSPWAGTAAAGSSMPRTRTSTSWRPSSGALGWIDTFAIPAKAKNVAAAYKWINFIMRPENAGYFTTRIEVRLRLQGANQLRATRRCAPTSNAPTPRADHRQHQVVSAGAGPPRTDGRASSSTRSRPPNNADGQRPDGRVGGRPAAVLGLFRRDRQP